MTTPTSVPGPATEPVYRSRKEAREARLAAEEASVCTSVDSVDTAEQPAMVEVAEGVDDLAGAGVISRTARRKFREAEQRRSGETLVGVSERVSKYKTFPVAASLSMMLVCLPGLAVADHLMEPQAKHSPITSAAAPLLPEPAVSVEPAVAPSPVAPAPAVEAPTPAPVAPASPVTMTSGDIPVASKVAYGQNYGSFKIDRFGEAFPRLFLEGGSKVAQMNPIVDALDEHGRHVVARYPSTALLGAKGLVGLAGHRGVGELSPFTRIHELQAGDTVTMDTAEGTYVYSMLWQQGGIDPLAPGANRILKDPVYRTADKTGEPVERALVITTCGLFANGDGDESVRVATYFEFKSFTPRA